MRKLFLGGWALVAMLATSSSHAADVLADDVLSSLYTMRAVYKAQYAPADWKKQFTAYDLDAEFKKAVAAVTAQPNLTQKESREILKNFIYAMKDYHVSLSFHSTEVATLPLTIKGTADRFFLMYIDRSKLTEAAFPFRVGDEVVTFDGKPTAQAVAEVQAEITENVTATDKAIAESNLTRRRAARGLNVPKGPITLGIKTQGSDKVQDVQLIWEYVAEKIRPRGQFLTLQTSLLEKPTSLFRPKMNVQMADADPKAANPYDMGARATFTPDLGTKIWESAADNTFYAYIYMNADRKLIGYVRVAGYIVDDYVKALADFSKIIERFEASTDAMVIDQVNNPGGSVFYLYGLASMLSDQPLKTPLHRMSIVQSDVVDALNQIQQLQNIKTDEEAQKAIKPVDLDGYPSSYEFVQFSLSYARFIVEEWTAGRTLSRPYWIGGVSHINPASKHYTKPILVLVNHLDFSGGDFFPAILQDNKRVTVMGTRTAGAGGYVYDIKVPNSIGVDSFRCTASIAERVDGNPIENLGVTPDVPYAMTAEDFTTNYAPYVKAIQTAVKNIIK